MPILKSLVIAFSTYSKLPMPKVTWNTENMRWSLCFFPAIGIAIGVLLLVWQRLCTLLSLNSTLFAAIATAIPILITGGIHMDGFCDTIDALSSHQSASRKLEILKDSHCGAFAIIQCCMYTIITFGLFTQVDNCGATIVALGYILSRALSGLAVVTFRSAHPNGLAASFANASNRTITIVVLVFYVIVTALLMLYVHFLFGLVSILFTSGIFLYYRHMAYQQFGGVTGDLAGYFLTMCELSILTSTIVSGGILALWN